MPHECHLMSSLRGPLTRPSSKLCLICCSLPFYTSGSIVRFSSVCSVARRSSAMLCPLDSLRWSSSAYAHYLGEACCFLALLHTHCGYRGSERVGMRELHWLIHPRMNHRFSWDIGLCVCVWGVCVCVCVCVRVRSTHLPTQYLVV